MDQTKRIDRQISFFLFTGLFLSLFFIYFAQERLFNQITTGSLELGFAKYLRMLSVITIFIAVLLSIFVSKTKYHHSIYLAYLVLITTVTLNFLVSGADFFDMTHFMDKKGIGTWICLGLIFVSYHEKRYTFFIKFLIFAVIFISLLSIYNFIDFGIGYYRGQALSKYRVYSVNLLWITPYVFLILKYNTKLKWLRIYVILIGIILALIIQARSFLLIYFITILFDFFNTKNKGSYTVLLVIGVVGFIFLILNTEILSTSLNLLLKRGANDTRSEQLVIFISQLNIFEVISGKGFFASYGFGYKQSYAVDNQWLYLLWWAGLLPVISYFYLCTVIPIKMIIKGNLSYETKVECFVLILWVLAMGGLAIYSTMSIELYFFIISIILGRVLYKYSNLAR